MSDQVLNILKLSLLGLIYLFFARVLWAVWSEVKSATGEAGRADPGTATWCDAASPAASAGRGCTGASATAQRASRRRVRVVAQLDS